MKKHLNLFLVAVVIVILIPLPGETEIPSRADSAVMIPDKVPAQPVADADIFRPGEKIRIRVSYIGFTAGYLETKVREQQVRGKMVYELKVTGESAGLANWFYTIRDQFTSYVDATGLFSLGYDYRQNHGGDKEFDSVRYDHDKGLFFKNGEPVGEFPAFSQDVVSALYFLRAQKLKVGEYYRFPVHLDDEAYKLEIYVEGKESVATRERGWVEAYRIRPSLQNPKKDKEMRQKLKNNENGVRIWISADQNKLPLQIALPAKIGSFWGYLEDYQPGTKY